jgi:NADP-dependent 3-hydroxy acid dehydrogenase YdfG
MLKGSDIVITGASSGIGRALAVALANEQARLHLLGRDASKLESLRQELSTTTEAITVYAFDLADDARVKHFAEQLGTLDVLIHSAGVVKLAPLAEAAIEDFDWHYRVNVRAPYLLTQLLLDKLSASQGDIVFVNSGAGLSAKASWSQYAASKFALRAIADSLRAEVQEHGVRVLSLYPGRTASPMQAQVKAMEGQPYEAAELIQPEDIAVNVVTALSLPRTAAITEFTIRPG